MIIFRPTTPTKVSLLIAAASLAAGILFADLPLLADAAPQGTSGSSSSGRAPADPGAAGGPQYGSSSVFLSAKTNDNEGDLGSVPPTTPSLIQQDPDEVKDAAGEALLAILRERAGFTGHEAILPIESQPIRVDKQQRAHIRYRQHVDGLPLEGASLSLHFDVGTGQVLAANGEFHSMDAIASNNQTDQGSLDCSIAMELALIEYLEQFSVANPAGVGGEWKDDCQPAAVQGRDGKPYLAYKRMYGFQPVSKETVTAGDGTSNATLIVESEPLRLDVLFADRVTGQLVALHPKVAGARTMRTYDCGFVAVDYPSQCSVVTSSPDKISTGDAALDDAHNYAVDTYDFYVQHFGRKGIDGKERKVQILVHYDILYNNAFFTPEFGGLFVFGDGDGFTFDHLSKGFDVVAHEFSHGVTHFTSGLVYSFESGALNEAFSDVMAAAADRLVKGKSSVDVWRIGEDIDLWNGVGIRNMEDPTDFGDPDYYAGRLVTGDDSGGVHTNSGIMNKAFYLMVAGGTHPLSGIVVPPLSTNFDNSIKQAATIFFNANTMCLTESSDYFSMRECTLLFATAAQKPTVQKAWDAVGVKAHLSLTPNVKRTGLTLSRNHDVQVFVLDRTVSPGESVTCSLKGTNGDPDLSVRFGLAPNLFPNYSLGNDCWSATDGTIETCTADAVPAPNSKVYVAVEAFEAATNMELLCTVDGDSSSSTLAPTTRPPTRAPTRAPTRFPTRAPATCKAPGTRCTAPAQCCQTPSAAACDGPSASSRVCKACKRRGATCARPSQCCAGMRCSGRRCV